MPRPTIRHRVLQASRPGAAAGENEDAAAVAAEAWPIGAAVADGATESAFAGDWARSLVSHLAQDRAVEEEPFGAAVDAAREDWEATVAEQAAGRPWYVQAKAAEGAFAAVLCLCLREDGAWRALSVGDCCLFQLRDGHLQETWPFEDPEAFTNRPALVASRANRSTPAPRTAAGTWAVGDTLLLATDAVAAWLLRSDRPAVADGDAEAFRAAVATAREAGTLRTDDATVLVLSLGDRA